MAVYIEHVDHKDEHLATEALLDISPWYPREFQNFPLLKVCGYTHANIKADDKFPANKIFDNSKYDGKIGVGISCFNMINDWHALNMICDKKLHV